MCGFFFFFRVLFTSNVSKFWRTSVIKRTALWKKKSFRITLGQQGTKVNHTSIFLIYNFTYHTDNNASDFAIHFSFSFSFFEQEAYLRDTESLCKVELIAADLYDMLIRWRLWGLLAASYTLFSWKIDWEMSVHFHCKSLFYFNTENIIS